MRYIRLAAVLLLVACGDSGTTPTSPPTTPTPPTPVATSITLSATSLSFSSLSETSQLTATVKDQNGATMSGASVSWSSSSTSVATVSSSGLVTSVADGSATITATSGSASASASATVAQAAHSIQISPAAIHLFSTNETIQLLAVVLDSLGAEVSAETIEWSSSDGNVASIEASGIVTGRSFGKTTLIASSGTINATATVSVQDGRWAQLAKPGGDNGICALRESGEAFCWGRNDVGQAGNGTSGDAIDDPSPVSGGHTFVMLARSSPNTCGLALSGMTYCWGFFTYDGIEETRGPANVLEPRAITHVVTRGEPVEPFANDFVSLSGGAQSLCALSRSGEAFCWGQNSYGQLGDSSANYGPVPSRVAGSHSWTSLSLGARHGCGVTNQGAAYCWGINESGQLGNGSTALTRVPTLVAGGLDWASVFAGANSTCAITTVGNSYCWGRNTQGEVGDGTTEDRLVPTLVTALGERRATRIWLSRFITCAVDSTGEGICWGDKPKNHPARSLSGSPWRSIVYQGGVPYALSEQGVLYVDGLVIL